jgi:hypothetical protein
VFIVAVAIFEKDRAELEKICERYEKDSGKGKRKWNRSNPESRLTYLRMVIDDERFSKTLCYSPSVPPLRTEFDARTVLGIAKAIQWKQPKADYTSEIYIDGITEAKKTEYVKELRAIGIHVHRVRRATDDTSAFIRLADALAGLAREALEGREESVTLLRRAIKRKVIAEV